MNITEVRIKLMEGDALDNGRLRAFCSITFDDMFVVRDLKIVEGPNGLFVAMPSRKITARCFNCGVKNHLRSRYCHYCGRRQQDGRVLCVDGRPRLHEDVAHPINATCREKIQAAVLAAHAVELEDAKLPGYASRYEDYEVDDCEAAYQAYSQDEPRTLPTISDRLPVRGRA